ncbi:MAG TPA: hypothetical protein VFU80_04900, partial [Sphingomicrobium sp.]|nr:hypothetical protein [Sphingomicrobium sp.]
RAALAIPFEWPSSSAPASSAGFSPHAQFDDPLQPAVIERAIADAVKFNAEGDLAATAEYSRACYDKLRTDPSLTWFDSCAAFDEATVALSGESPFSESGPFDAASVIARQLGGARLLSNDTLEVDSRLQQIRSQVELALLPGLDEPTPQQR